MRISIPHIVRNQIAWLSLSISAITLASGCGPISAHSAIAKAHIAIEAAEGARAQDNAIFEYHSALLYLDKAKREEGLSSFQSAVDLARASRRYADQARARALQRSRARPMTPAERRAKLTPQAPEAAPASSGVAPSAPVTPVAPAVPPVAPTTPSLQ